MFKNKKVIIWDLDNTLYRVTPEFGHMLDILMAQVGIDLGAKLSLEKALETVKESFSCHRDGGQIFYDHHGVEIKKFYDTYHKRVPFEFIKPYKNFAEKVKLLPFEQYVFTYSSRELAEKILKQIGLYEFFKGRFYSVEDFGEFSKNKSCEVYVKLCKKIKHKPEECIFVDDSYSNLEFPKNIGMTTVRIFYNSNSAKDKKYIDAAYKGAPAFINALAWER